MMDPFQINYRKLLSGALVVPCLLVNVLWVSCTLPGLGKHACLASNKPFSLDCAYCFFLTGATMSVILDLPWSELECYQRCPLFAIILPSVLQYIFSALQCDHVDLFAVVVSPLRSLIQHP